MCSIRTASLRELNLTSCPDMMLAAPMRSAGPFSTFPQRFNSAKSMCSSRRARRSEKRGRKPEVAALNIAADSGEDGLDVVLGQVPPAYGTQRIDEEIVERQLGGRLRGVVAPEVDAAAPRLAILLFQGIPRERSADRAAGGAGEAHDVELLVDAFLEQALQHAGRKCRLTAATLARNGNLRLSCGHPHYPCCQSRYDVKPDAHSQRERVTDGLHTAYLGLAQREARPILTNCWKKNPAPGCCRHSGC